MIKLIATDIDGTLVNDSKDLPPDFGEVISKLEAKGITFAIASGRSYAALEAQFKDYGSRLAYICDNGANIIIDGETVSRSIMPIATVREMLSLCSELGLIPLLCAEHGTYYSNDDALYAKEVRKYYNNCVYMPDLTSCSDEVFKLAVYCKGNIEQQGYKQMQERFGSRLSLGLSGIHWVDVMNGGVNKGRGIHILQQALGAEYDECMAFGDYLNDLEMLRCCGESFAMEKCHPLIAVTARYRTGSNNDFAVMSEIRQRVLGEPARNISPANSKDRVKFFKKLLTKAHK
ncbi:MAG: HAD family hydrolase [Ruminococcus sp.]|nr:HAD family hydrolase [Ruminococcus sp.]